ncbi:MAG: hypothetical protein U5K38_12905 [Woeseiaceae bacterium]|nr:hypothetical protein [Woeseiaceae bacterium]
MQLDHMPAEFSEYTGMMITIGRYLRGLAEYFAMLATTLRVFGEWLIDEAQGGHEQ